MEYSLVEPYGLNHEQRVQDNKKIQNLYEILLEILTSALNDFHGVENSTRYWEILLGHWLKLWLSVILNRYYVLTNIFGISNNYKINLYDTTSYNFSTNDTLEFIKACNDPSWNHHLFSRLISLLKPAHCEFDIVSEIDDKKFVMARGDLNPTSLRSRIKEKLGLFLHIFSGESYSVIRNSYLPLQEELKLQVMLGQVPQFWQVPDCPINFESEPDRDNFSVNFSVSSEFEKIVLDLIADFIPDCFMENYQNLVSLSKHAKLPKSPKFIFTSNDFMFNEVFKEWTARKCENGTKYFVGQHGNNYGTYIGNTELTEIRTCDGFISWGSWKNKYNILPGFVLKTAGKTWGHDSKGYLLFIHAAETPMVMTWDTSFERKQYMNSIFDFAASVSEPVSKNMVVRFPPGHLNVRTNDQEEWYDKFPELSYELGKLPIRKLIDGARIVVYSYDSTGLLENFSMNIPTIGFWRSGLDHVEDGVLCEYEYLKDAGLIFFDEVNAAQHINKWWENIGDWWLSDHVQAARKRFCSLFARTEKAPIRTIKNLISVN